MMLTAMPSRGEAGQQIYGGRDVGKMIDHPVTINEIGHCLWLTTTGLFAASMNIRDELLPIDPNKRAGTAAQRGDNMFWIVPGPNVWNVTWASAIYAYLITSHD